MYRCNAVEKSVCIHDRSLFRTLLVSFLWECAGNLLLQHLAGPRDRFTRKDRILLITGTTLRSPRVALGIVRVTISRLENGRTLPTEREILSRILRLGCIDYFRKIFRGGQLLGVYIKWRIKIYSWFWSFWSCVRITTRLVQYFFLFIHVDFFRNFNSR